MIMRHSYPFSPLSGDELISPSTTPKIKKHRVLLPSAMDNTGSSQITTLDKPQSAVRRARTPPLTAQGVMYCDHVNCAPKPPTFKRVCEWNKHMDRHERPYKCREAGCELNPGFTYSGGLLRHQREVHRMHLSTKQPLFCPYPNCSRSSGNGFTRKENLEEHKRRRHLDEMSEEPTTEPAQPLSEEVRMSSLGSPLKRRRTSTSHGLGQEQQDSQVASQVVRSPASESDLVQQLRMQIRQKDEILMRQAAEIHRLQNLLRALPPQAMYGVMPSRLPGGGVG
jgi:hypothetical protein